MNGNIWNWKYHHTGNCNNLLLIIRNTFLLKGIDKLFEILDDQIVKIQAMKGSAFAKPFESRISSSEERLLHVQQLINEWLQLQTSWLYLEPIFSSDDIMLLLPTEGRR